MDSVISFVRRVIPPTETNFFVPSTWIYDGATIDLDFAGDRYWSDPDFLEDTTSLLSISRASDGYAQTSSGTFSLFSSNTLRRTDLGLLIEEGKTNVVLWCRDLTNVVWTPTNITAALDQTGIDGSANSASSILATANDGTILQSVTHASSDRIQSAWVKRITGSGVISLTMDNGTTWTPITVTSDWTLAELPIQTLANPVVGFRIGTNGDKIAVDFVQNEPQSGFGAVQNATSPILTTTAAAARATDIITFTGSADTLLKALPQSVLVNTKMNMIVRWYYTYVGGDSVLLQVDADALIQTKAYIFSFPGAVGLASNIFGNSLTWSTGVKVASAQDSSGRSIVGGGGVVATDALFGTDATNPHYLGTNNGTGGSTLYGYIRRLTLWNSRLADVTLQTLTSP